MIGGQRRTRLLDQWGRPVTEISRLINPDFRFVHIRSRMGSEMPRPSSPAIRRWVLIWLAWTAAGLFYISQDFITRLTRNESIPWRNVVIAWMAAMYICAAFTPVMLRLGRKWPIA